MSKSHLHTLKNGSYFLLPFLLMGIGIGGMVVGVWLVWTSINKNTPSLVQIPQPVTVTRIPPTVGHLDSTLAPPSPYNDLVYVMPVMEVETYPLQLSPTELPLDSPMPATKTMTLLVEGSVTPSPMLVPVKTPPNRVFSSPQQIEIPSIEMIAPIVPVGWSQVEIDGQPYGQWEVPNFYASGWHQTSAMPQQNSNIVLNGHHNIYGRVFARLIEVQVGDLIILSTGQQIFRYTVTQTMVLPESGQPLDVRLENARWLLPTDGERVTLITCWPPDGNTHRLVVIALPEAQMQP